MRLNRLPAAVALALTLAASVHAQTVPTAAPNDSLKWEYENGDLTLFNVAVFLVCVDAQPTAACAQVPIAAGVPAAGITVRTWTWKLPALAVGPHTATVQACTAAAESCSTGERLSFAIQVIANPKNLRLGSGR